MLATTEIIELLEQTDQISAMINQSEQMFHYIVKKRELAEDQVAQNLIRTFTKMKEQYEDVQRFGRYHPDFSKVTKEIRLMKREIDMLDSVAQFKLAERELQILLDDISERLAFSVSQQIIVPRDGALFSEGGCGCGSGGSCGCKVS